MRTSPYRAPLRHAQTMTESRKRVGAAIGTLLRTQPFFGSLALRLPVEPTDKTKTIACDGQKLFYNDEWVPKQSFDHLVSCIARLVLACSLKHHTRRGSRDYNTWQKAIVMVTNPILEAENLGGGFGWDNLSVEQAYDKLPSPKPDDKGKGGQKPGQQGASPPSPPKPDPKGQPQQQPQPKPDTKGTEKPKPEPKEQGEIMDAPACARDDKKEKQDPADAARQQAKIKEEEQTWDEAAHQATQLAKSAGKSPGKVNELLQTSHQRLIGWKQLLRRFITEKAKADYSWKRPNRRHIHSGLYLPSLHSEKMGDIYFAIDTSGSMDSDLLRQVWTEIRSAAMQVKPKSVIVMQCDTIVRCVLRYTGIPPETLSVTGREGTRFTPVFNEINHRARALPGYTKPKLLIYFTDLHCRDYPKERPSFPVLWAVPKSHGSRPPFGRILALKKRT